MRKWAPQEVVLFITLEVVLKLTLERLKSGTKTNSPVYIYADESNNGTLFSQKQVKQRDARTLNNGTRPVSRYKNSVSPFFWV